MWDFAPELTSIDSTRHRSDPSVADLLQIRPALPETAPIRLLEIRSEFSGRCHKNREQRI